MGFGDKLKELLGKTQLVSQEDVDSMPAVQHGRASIAKILQSVNPDLNDQQAMDKTMANEKLAQQASNMTGSITNVLGSPEAMALARARAAAENLPQQTKIFSSSGVRPGQMSGESQFSLAKRLSQIVNEPTSYEGVQNLPVNKITKPIK